MPAPGLPIPLVVTVGAANYHGTYTVEDGKVRVECGKLEGEAELGERPVKRAAEQLLRALVVRAGKSGP